MSGRHGAGGEEIWELPDGRGPSSRLCGGLRPSPPRTMSATVGALPYLALRGVPPSSPCSPPPTTTSSRPVPSASAVFNLHDITATPSDPDDKQRDGGADGQMQDESRDNRSLVDNNTAQTLSSEDIEAMKREGVSGDAIVEALIANSSTFGNKIVFSQVSMRPSVTV
ncbi:hypothetical protein ZWY2020_023262 [Hordeum vulgare]|nr:hypothetical protein ZWY2020_023262 [Hordeum vulgare]